MANRQISAFLALFLMAASIFGAVWELSCDDGTKYGQCSSGHPGYYCAQNGTDAVGLQKVVGEVNPEGHPKAGQATTLAIQCACSKYEGYEEKSGQCVKIGEEPVETVPVVQNQTPNTQGTQNQSANETALNESVGQVQEAENESGFIPADLLDVPQQAQEQEDNVQAKSDDSIWPLITGVVVVSVVGAVLIGIIIIAGLYGLKHFRRRKGL